MVADQFEAFYNASAYDSIFSLFSEKMKEALPLESMKEFFTGMQTESGKITKRQFQHYKGSYASYKTNFERALFDVLISVDNNSKINALRQYEDSGQRGVI